MLSQDNLAAALLDPSVAVPPGIVRRRGIESCDRLEIYRNNITASLIDALSDTFSVTSALVGEMFFRAAAREYIRDNLPSSPVLAWYGETFPDFLACFQPVRSVAYLSDVARLEWLYQCSLHAAELPTLDTKVIEHLLEDRQELPNIAFTFHPTAFLISSEYPITSIWLAHQHDDVDLSAVKFDQAEACLLSRPASRVIVTPLTRSTWKFFYMLQCGRNLGDAYHEIFSQHPDFRLVDALAALISSGGISSVTTQNSN